MNTSLNPLKFGYRILYYIIMFGIFFQFFAYPVYAMVEHFPYGANSKYYIHYERPNDYLNSEVSENTEPKEASANNNALKTKHVTKSHKSPAPSVTTNVDETAIEIFSQDKSGTIGYDKDSNSDDPSDNIFSFNIEKQILAGKEIRLSYEVYGIENVSGISRSINQNNATGGYLVKKNSQWNHLEETISLNQLKNGVNHLLFTAFENKSVDYKIKNVSIKAVPAVQHKLLTLADGAVLYTKNNKAYLKGSVLAGGFDLYVNNEKVAVKNNEFETVIAHDSQTKQLDVQLRNKENVVYNETVHLTEVEDAALQTFNKAEGYSVIKELEDKSYGFLMDEVGFNIRKDSYDKLQQITVQKLRPIDLAPLGTNIINVTQNKTGYRFLPEGAKFKDQAQVTVKFDKTLLPNGYNAEDVKILYFDMDQRRWLAIATDTIMADQNKIMGLTDHFTDYIAGIIQSPESPETSSFTPTSISDIQVANPTANIVQIQPPTANQKGDGTLDFPITVPPGRGGLQPNLSVSYNNNGSSGIVGYGWDIAIPYISVDTKFGVPAYDPQKETESYLLNGEELLMQNGTALYLPHRQAAPAARNTTGLRNFFPKVEGSFSKIERHGNTPSTYTWIVWDKSGNSYHYGLNTNSTLSSSTGSGSKWYLTKIVDKNSNSVNYMYGSYNYGTTSGNLNGGQEKVIGLITYNHGDQYKPYYWINFTYRDSRSDQHFNYRYGFKEVNSKLLDNIKIKSVASNPDVPPENWQFHESDFEIDYKFGYSSGKFGKTLLNTITTENKKKNGTTIVSQDSYTHNFEYFDDLGGGSLFGAAETIPVQSDFPGDKHSVLSSTVETYNSSEVNVGAGISPAANPPAWWPFSYGGTINFAFPSKLSTSSSPTMMLLDMDGDGLADKVVKIGNEIKYHKNIGGFAFSSQLYKTYHIGDLGWNENVTKNHPERSISIIAFNFSASKSQSNSRVRTFLTDVNGDGLVDYVKDKIVYFNRIAPDTDAPTFTTDSNLTPNVIYKEGDVQPGISSELPDLSLGEDLMDVVKVWVAPKKGTIQISGNISKAYVASHNGVRYSVENSGSGNGLNYWAGNWPVKNIPIKVPLVPWTPGNIPIVNPVPVNLYAKNYVVAPKLLITASENVTGTTTVDPGDHIYFRVNSSQVPYEKVNVNWDPIVNYVGETPSKYSDAYLYGDSVLETLTVAQPGNYVFEWDNINVGQLGGKINIIVRAYKLLYNTTTQQSEKKIVVTGTPIEFVNNTVSNNSSLVNPNKSFNLSSIVTNDPNTYVYFEVEAIGEKNKLINWKQFDNVFIPRLKKNTTPVEIRHIVPKYDMYNNSLTFYPVSSFTAPATINIKNNFSLTGCAGNCGNEKISLIVTDDTGQIPVTSNGMRAKFEYRVNSNGNVTEVRQFNSPEENAGTVINVPESFLVVQPGKKYNFDYYTESYMVASALNNYQNNANLLMQNYDNTLTSPKFTGTGIGLYRANITTKQAQESGLGTLYRNWGQFAYKGANPDENFTPIEQSYVSRLALAGVKDPLQPSADEQKMFKALENKTVDDMDYDFENEKFLVSGANMGLNQNQLEAMKHFTILRSTRAINAWSIHKRLYVGSASMSPYLRYDNEGENRMLPVAVPSGVGTYGAVSIMKEGVSESKSKGRSVGFFGFSLGTSESTGNSRQLNDYMDINGDGYPDIIGDQIQLTSSRGGLSTTNILNKALLMPTNSAGSGKSAGGSSAHILPIADKSGRLSSFKVGSNATFSPSVGGGANMFTTISAPEGILVDLNGDGLVDLVKSGTDIEFNTAKAFIASSWNGFVQPKSSKTLSQSLSASFGTSLTGAASSNLDMSFGISGSTSTTYDTKDFVDFNGDGLPDYINDDKVLFNYGTSHGASVSLSKLAESSSSSIGATINASVLIPITIPIPVFPLILKVGGGGGASTGKTYNQENVSFRDFDADGYVDMVESTSEGALKVSSSRIKRTNMLKKVTNPTGSVIELDYATSNVISKTTFGPNYKMPFKKWVLSEVTVKDGFTGDGADAMQYSFEYENGLKDRRERKFLGFGKVTSYQLKANKEVYRYSVQEYLLNDMSSDEIYLPGNNSSSRKYQYIGNLLKSETVYDATKRILNKSENEYVFHRLTTTASAFSTATQPVFNYEDVCRILPLIKRTKSSVHHYQGQGSSPVLVNSVSALFDTYDKYGNVTHYVDEAETPNVNVNIAYHVKDVVGTRYVVNIPSSHKVDNYKRYSTTVLDTKGNIIEINRFKDYLTSTTLVAKTTLAYDVLGNLTKVTLPAPVVGGTNRMFFEYEYDNLFKKSVTKVKDAYGYESSTTYNHFGLPLTQKDLNGIVFTNTYDAMNRLVQMKGPYNSTWTIKNEYKKATGSNLRYAVTKHNIKDESVTPGEQILHTSSFADGLGRIVQTKKQLDKEPLCGASTNGYRFATSGLQKYDEFGRVVESYLGQEESNCSATFISGLETYKVLTSQPAEKTSIIYDSRDRVLQNHVYGLNATTNYKYSFGPDPSGTQYAFEKVTLPEGNISIAYKDAKDRVRTSSQVDQGGAYLSTWYQYNTLSEVIKVIDTKGKSTDYIYDNFGQKSQVTHPDNGISKFTYDLAGKIVTTANQNLILANKKIEYEYNFNQLINIKYPDYTDVHGTYFPVHTVKYQYGAVGAASNSVGRITTIEDLTGKRQMKYGKLGEVVEEARLLNSQSGSMSFTTKYNYDSWGRLMNMTYPDNEVVTYGYNNVGQLKSILSSLGQWYLKDVKYNFFDQPTEITYGNDVVTKNEYDITQRIRAMQINRPGNSPLMRNVYTYDGNQNITRIKNDISQHGLLKIGGVFDKTYEYDDFNRLKKAQGSWQGGLNETHNYKLDMVYDQTHGIVTKSQNHTANGAKTLNSYVAAYEYLNTAHPHAVSKIKYTSLEGTKTATSDFEYDANGNMTKYLTNYGPFTNRKMMWDVQNRLSAVVDDSRVSHYVYDHAGERTFKAVGDITTINIGGSNIHSVANFNQYTIYPSGYIVVDPNKSEYSKHYYINSKRFVSRLNPYSSGMFAAPAGKGTAQNEQGLAGDNGIVLDEALNVQNVTYGIVIGNDPNNCSQQITAVRGMFAAANNPPTASTQHCIDYIDNYLMSKVGKNGYTICDALVELNTYVCTPKDTTKPDNGPDPTDNPVLTPGQIAENDCLTKLNILIGQLYNAIETAYDIPMSGRGAANSYKFPCNIEVGVQCCIDLKDNSSKIINGICPTCPEITLANCGEVRPDDQLNGWYVCIRQCLVQYGPEGNACLMRYLNTGVWTEDCYQYLLTCDCSDFVKNIKPDKEIISCLRNCTVSGVAQALEEFDQTGTWKPEYNHFILECDCNSEEPENPTNPQGPEIAACLKDCKVPGATECYNNYKAYGEWLPGCSGIIDQCDCETGMPNTDPNCPLEAYMYIQNNLVLEPVSNACTVYNYVMTHYNCVRAPREGDPQPTDPGDLPGGGWTDPGTNNPNPGTDGPYNEALRKPIWWYHTDHLGSSTYLTDNFGRPSHYYETLPFGEMMVEHNQSANNPANKKYNNAYKFNGKELDDATGMYYYGARYYDPRISIFVSVDPLAEKYPGWTPYHYVHNNPVNMVDPTGMEAEWIPGTDGKAIDYKRNEDGIVEFSKNTPDDLKDVMSEMVKSEKGDEVLRKAIDSKTKINVTISDKTGPDNAKTGEIWFGRNKAVDYDRKKDLIFESDITIYKGTFSNLKNDGTKVWSFGTRGKSDLKNLKYSGLLNINQNMAGALGHELIHTLDPKSSSALYPKLPESSIESLPESVGKQIHYDLMPSQYK